MFGAIVGIASAAYGIYSAKKAEKKQTKAAKEAQKQENAYLTWSEEIAEKRMAREIRQTIGAQRVRYAKAGVKIGTGTPQRIEDYTLDQMTEDYQIMKKQYDFAREGSQLAQQAAVDEAKAKAKAAYAGGIFQAGNVLASYIDQKYFAK